MAVATGVGVADGLAEGVAVGTGDAPAVGVTCGVGLAVGSGDPGKIGTVGVGTGVDVLATECGGRLPPPEQAARNTDTATNTIAAAG
jgi:hypothetical protein